VEKLEALLLALYNDLSKEDLAKLDSPPNKVE